MTSEDRPVVGPRYTVAEAATTPLNALIQSVPLGCRHCFGRHGTVIGALVVLEVADGRPVWGWVPTTRRWTGTNRERSRQRFLTAEPQRTGLVEGDCPRCRSVYRFRLAKMAARAEDECTRHADNPMLIV